MKNAKGVQIALTALVALAALWLFIRWRRQKQTEEVETTAQTINRPADQSGRNVAAFLAAIRYAEGTDRRPDPYRVVFGYSVTLKDLSDHPANTGEWKGQKLPDATCRGAGLKPGCVSTAAGAYQIIRPTWNAVKSKLGLKDFSPASQDKAAIELIRQRGALDLVKSGRFAEAVNKVRKEWASLPGAGYNQPERSLAQLTTIYKNNGGQTA